MLQGVGGEGMSELVDSHFYVLHLLVHARQLFLVDVPIFGFLHAHTFMSIIVWW